MASLYEIEEQILNCVDLETGEIIDEEALANLSMERDAKVENIALWIKNLLAEAKMIKEEKDNLANRQKVCENKAESLKEYLSGFLAGEKFKTSKVNISYRKSERVDVSDITKLDDDYLKFKEPEPDKTKIKKALKDGVQLRGVQLVENRSIQIK